MIRKRAFVIEDKPTIWKGDWALLYKVYHQADHGARIVENINPMYPLYEEIELPETYKYSDGASYAVSGEIIKIP